MSELLDKKNADNLVITFLRPVALRKTKTPLSFSQSECYKVKNICCGYK